MTNPAFLCVVLSVALPLELASGYTEYTPKWNSILPKNTVRVSADPQASEASNGQRLRHAVDTLQPGDYLEISSGRYSIDSLWNLSITGTAQDPIWIVAAKGASVIITRRDANQNILNIGSRSRVQFLAIRGLEFTGGSHGIRIGNCNNVWIDQCHIHHTGEVCLSANSADTHHIFLTRNEIHDGGGTAEGMYLGANHGKVVMSKSVIANNHVYNCGGSQGDGIEVKQGSWGNLIAANKIHDCNYPCITVYGTNGKPQNIVERNLCFRSNDNVMQIQGEAIVRNNIMIGGQNSAFASTDHQGQTTNLQVIHNTILNIGHAFRGSSWNGRSDMVLANNVIYSLKRNAMLFPNGAQGATITGNVVVGDGAKFGSRLGRGLEDFTKITLEERNQDISALDVKPTKDAPFKFADEDFRLPIDLTGRARKASSLVSGALLP